MKRLLVLIATLAFATSAFATEDSGPQRKLHFGDLVEVVNPNSVYYKCRGKIYDAPEYWDGVVYAVQKLCGERSAEFKENELKLIKARTGN